MACLCGSCSKDVKKSQKSLQCDLCARWFHAMCQGVTDDVYKVITKDSNTDNPQIQWYCNSSCKLLNKKFVNTFNRIENDVAIIRDRVDAIDSRVEWIEQKHTVERLERI